MALITCPDCNNEVSDKASVCPKCGYPISDFVMELEEKKAQEELEKEAQKRKEEAAIIHSFTINGEQFDFNGSQRICAYTLARIENQRALTHSALVTIYQNGFSPANMKDGEFAQMGVEWLSDKGYIVWEHIWDDYLQNVINGMGQRQIYELLVPMNSLYDAIYEVNQEAKEQFDLDFTNAHMEYGDGWHEAEYISPPIESIYARDLGSLIGGTIRAKLINSAHEAFNKPKVERKKEAVVEKWHNDVNNAFDAWDATVLSFLDRCIDSFFDSLGETIVNALYSANVIFDVDFNYSLKQASDRAKLNEQIKKKTNKNNSPYNYISRYIKKNPGDVYGLIFYFNMIEFETEDEFTNYVEFTRFILGDANEAVIEEILKENKKTLKQNIEVFKKDSNLHEYFLKYQKPLIDKKQKEKEEKERAQRTYDGILFDTIDEKRIYQNDSERFSQSINLLCEDGSIIDADNYINSYRLLEAKKDLIMTDHFKNLAEKALKKISEKKYDELVFTDIDDLENYVNDKSKCEVLVDSLSENKFFSDLSNSIDIYRQLLGIRKELKSLLWKTKVDDILQFCEKYTNLGKNDNGKLYYDVLQKYNKKDTHDDAVVLFFSEKSEVAKKYDIDVYAFLVINQMIITPKEFFVIENSSKNIIPLNEITSIAILRTKNDGDKCVPFIQIGTNNGKKYDFYIEGNQLKKNSDVFFILNKLQKYSPSVNEIIIEEESKIEKYKVEKTEVGQSRTEESISNNINADNPTKFCVFCGSKIARTAKFCNYCGKRMTT